ncbi:putative chaperone involved in Fe-S cluster assembly and activation; hesB-like [Candidatus Terasakiella magnetica]|nr:putative chaperone involved in Fe-S cluster assembly and activation; hesB-like [Candidatus Terasakiella magnetica]
MAETEHNFAARVSVTENAAERVQTLIQLEGKPNLMLRLGVSGGGCSGFSYGISLDDKINDDDRVFEDFGIRLVIDQTALDMLDGSVVDYVEDLAGASFQVKNPNASSTCGCGSSFSA